MTPTTFPCEASGLYELAAGQCVRFDIKVHDRSRADLHVQWMPPPDKLDVDLIFAYADALEAFLQELSEATGEDEFCFEDEVFTTAILLRQFEQLPAQGGLQ